MGSVFLVRSDRRSIWLLFNGKRIMIKDVVGSRRLAALCFLLTFESFDVYS